MAQVAQFTTRSVAGVPKGFASAAMRGDNESGSMRIGVIHAACSS
jgi:hypothetical protein